MINVNTLKIKNIIIILDIYIWPSCVLNLNIIYIMDVRKQD
jgi:hypothetical protein